MSEYSKSYIDVFSDVIRRLEINHIPYMVVGSVASMIYGEVRLTRDMDLVVDIPVTELKKIHKIFPLSEFYCPPDEILSDECMRRGQFNLLHHDS